MIRSGALQKFQLEIQKLSVQESLKNPPGQACLTWALSKLFCSSLAETFFAPSVQIPDKQRFISSPAQHHPQQVLLPVKTHFQKCLVSVSEKLFGPCRLNHYSWIERLAAILYIQPGLPLVYSVYLKFIIVRLRIWEIVSTTGFHMAKFNEQRQNPERQNPAVAPKCLFVFFHLFYGWVGGKVPLILVRDQQNLLGTSGSPKNYPHWQSRRS